MFRVPTYTLVHPAELLGYAVMGLVGGVASVLFARLLGSLRLRLTALPRWTRYVQPAGAGFVIGALCLEPLARELVGRLDGAMVVWRVEVAAGIVVAAAFCAVIASRRRAALPV